MFHRFMSWILCVSVFCLNVAPSTGFAAVGDSPPPVVNNNYAIAQHGQDNRATVGANATSHTAAEVEAFLDEFMKLLEELRTHIDRSQFELDALLSRLDYDSDKIISFVKQDIRFEQYPGLLRGAEGTLMSRAGNALDQSVLLANLLNDAGYEARIASAALNEEQAKDLINQMFLEKRSKLPLGDMQKINAVMTSLGKLSGVPEVDLATFLDAPQSQVSDQSATDQLKSRADAEFIFKILDEAGIALGDPEAVDALNKEAREYFWVEYRMGPADPWSSTHPALNGQNDSLAGLKATKSMQGSVPDELQHRFRFRAYIEQKTGNDLTEYALMDTWERPVANLVGISLSYANMPLKLRSADDMKKIREVLASNNVFIPFYNESAAGPNTFDLAGRLIPIEARMSNYAAVFETVTEKSTLAASSLASLDQSDAEVEGGTLPFMLSAHWLEYTFIKPNGQETTYRRELLDRIGTAARAEGSHLITEKLDTLELNTYLASFQSFMVATGEYPDALIFDHAVERLIDMRPTLSFVLQGKAGQGGATADSSSAKYDVTYPFQLAQLAYYVHVDQQSQPEKGMVSYRGEPSLIVQSKRLSGDDKSVSSFDIVTNKHRVFELFQGQVNLEPKQAVLIGTRETRAETFLHRGRELPNRSFINAVGVFEEAIAAGIPMKVLRPGSSNAMLQNMAVGEATRHHIERDLNSGYVLILPQRSPRENSEYFAWWRINPATGETLGVISNGLGGDIEEELMLKTPMMIMSLALAGMGGLTGFVICAESAPDYYSTSNVALCCFADALVGGGSAFIAGMVIGAYVGALLGFLVMDLGGGFVMLGGGILGYLPTFCT